MRDIGNPSPYLEAMVATAADIVQRQVARVSLPMRQPLRWREYNRERGDSAKKSARELPQNGIHSGEQTSDSIGATYWTGVP
jgi:hypothetical protein